MTPDETARAEVLARIADQIAVHRLALDLEVESPYVVRCRKYAIRLLRFTFARERDNPPPLPYRGWP